MRVRGRSRRLLLGIAGLTAVVALVGTSCTDGSGDTDAEVPTHPTRPPGTEQTSPTQAQSAGCGGTVVPAGDSEQFFTSAGEQRRYLQTVPPTHGAGNPQPVVIDLHGYAEGAELHAAETALAAYGTEQGFVTITPNGGGAIPKWDMSPDANTDVTTIYDLLDAVEHTLCIDTSRVYVTGLSNGAMLTTYLACDEAGRITAVAPVAGVLDPDVCSPTRPVPAIIFHGADDPFMPMEGGVGGIALDFPTETGTMRDLLESARPPVDAPVDDRVDSWASRNDCAAEPVTTAPADQVRLLTYECPDGADVEFYIVDNGGHTWPGSRVTAGTETVFGHTTVEIDANELMWSFFQRHRL